MAYQLDVQELHRDLARKHLNVGSKVDAIWHKFTPKQREQATKDSTGHGRILKHSRDRSLGDLGEYIPEYNLWDMSSTPEHFLNIFTFRALIPLYDQLFDGANGAPGDRELMEKTRLHDAQAYPEEKTFFLEGELYGQTIKPGPAAGGRFPRLPFEDTEYFVMPRAIGELIVQRQQFLFQFLNNIIEDILEAGSETRTKKAPEKNVNEALAAAVSNLKVQPTPLKSSLPEVRGQAMDSKAALEDYLLLLRAEPIVLNQAVKIAYWTRPELVSDDRGPILPVVTDRHLSAAFFDSMTTAVKAIAI